MDSVLYLICRTTDCDNAREGVKAFCKSCLEEYAQTRQCLTEGCTKKRVYQKNGMLFRYCWDCEKTRRQKEIDEAPTCLYCDNKTMYNHAKSEYYKLCKDCYNEKKCPNFSECHNYRLYNEKAQSYYKTCQSCRYVHNCQNDTCDSMTIRRDSFCSDCQASYDAHECIYIRGDTDEYCGNKTQPSRRQLSQPLFCILHS